MEYRKCVKTGKKYTNSNLPWGRIWTATDNNGKRYKICNENYTRPNDSWYNGVFIGDRYAVFEQIKLGNGSLFYQQVSKWYIRFGYAQRKLYEFTKDTERRTNQ